MRFAACGALAITTGEPDMLIEGPSPRRRHASRALAALAALACALTILAITAPRADAATHDYCLWDGSYSANAAYVKCYASGQNLLTENYAWLVYFPTQPIIYCGANLGGAQYGSFTSGNPSCTHTYSGANLLKAVEYVSIAATTHGRITY